MLDVLRRGASTWISKLLLGLLIVSFGIWGIADVFRGFGSSVAFKIGSTEIGVAQFDQTYARELHQLSLRLKRPFNKDEALKTGVSRQVIDKVVPEATLSEVARDLRLGVSDATIAADITQDPSFKTPAGAFDRARFVDLLRSNGWNEDVYVAKRRADLLRSQLLEGVSGGLAAPKALVEVVDQYRNEQRSIRYVTISAETLGEIAPPADADLATFFEARKGAFRAPETRNFDVLMIDADTIARTEDVTDDDAKAEYERQKARFASPEKRRVNQLAFDDAAQAEAAAKKIAEGAKFADIVAERGAKAEDLDLGLIAKANFLDPKVADAAFALAKVGDVSGVVQGRFRAVLLELVEVAPGGVTPFEAVAADIKRDIAKRRAETDILSRHDQIEDALAGGAKLREVAQRFGLKPIVVEKMAKDGKLADGSTFSAVPNAAKLIAAVYESDVGVENETLDLGGKGFVWFALTAVDAARDRALAEVKDKVLDAWKAEETRKRLEEAAKRVTARLDKGEDFDTVVKDAGFEAKTSTEFKREDRPEELSPAVVAAAFDGPDGHHGSAPGNGDARIVFKVVSVTNPAFFETDDTRAMAERMGGSVQTTVLESWLARVQKDVGVYTHQQNVARVVGQTRD